MTNDYSNPINKEESINYDDINLQCCCFNMRKVSRAITQYFDRYLEPAGIRATQFNLLVALSTTSSRTLTDIAEGLVMDRTTLTRNLKPLEKSGYISNAKSYDKRAKSYKLTDKGKEILAKSLPYWTEAQNTIINMLSKDGYDSLLNELKRMLSVTSSLKIK